MNKNLFVSLEQALKKDPRFISNDENQILLKNVIRQVAEQLDESLISLLLDDSSLREVFFKPISDVIVFDSRKFITFLNNKEFLPDSYTAFKNKVGLSNTAGDYLSESDEVVLSFPYKDCVLAGGQDKEDTKRQEVFYNEVLGRDEIDRLLDPKTFTNFKKYTSAGEEKLSGFTRGEDGAIKDNLIIKGNNLLALHSLKKEFAGKVKLIYIDPPYNTGNDSFNYNDRFNHSTWLTFMKNRLEVARELLRDDGVIFVQCDDNEQAYLKVLMDDIFKGNFIETITVVNNPRGRDYGGIANMHEFINIFGKSENYTIFPLVNKDKEFPFEDDNGGFEIRELRNRNTKFNIDNRPNLVYPFFINPKNIDKDGFYEISLEENKGWIRLLPLKSQGIQTVWRWGKEKSLSNMNINIVGKIMKDGGFQIVEKYRGNSRMARSVWFDKEVNSERGTLHLKQLFNAKVFEHPKPEETLSRVIEMSTEEGDIVLDYHLGSGTTAAVAHKMGRQYIGVEQMDYIETISVERMKKVIEGEQGGVSKSVEWKGGGEFVYMEMMEANQKYLDKISGAKDTKTLLVLYKEIQESGFINYYVDIASIDENISEFEGLSLENQKRFLAELLDKNLLYVNHSEIEDVNYGVSDEEKKLNGEFYK